MRNLARLQAVAIEVISAAFGQNNRRGKRGCHLLTNEASPLQNLPLVFISCTGQTDFGPMTLAFSVKGRRPVFAFFNFCDSLKGIEWSVGVEVPLPITCS